MLFAPGTRTFLCVTCRDHSNKSSPCDPAVTVSTPAAELTINTRAGLETSCINSLWGAGMGVLSDT